MMRNGRYARHLQATRKKTAQPVEPVREWVERLYALFDESGVGETVDPTSVWTARECYEFLACQGGLWRARREVVADAADLEHLTKALHHAQILFERYGLRIAACALTVPNTQEWLKCADQVAERAEFTQDEDLTPAGQVEVASLVAELWQQLDEAELVCALATKAVLPVERPGEALADLELPYDANKFVELLEQIEDELANCHGWVYRHAEIFQLASIYIQSVALGLRDDLEETDYALDATTMKYDFILDELEAGERLLFGGVQPEDIPDWLRLSVTALGEAHERTVVPSGFLPAHPRTALAAVMIAADISAPERFFTWRSPGGEYEARLLVRDTWTLRLYTREGDRALDFAGKTVYLCDVPIQLDDQARAEVPSSEVLRTGKDLELRVGPRRQLWYAVPESPGPEGGTLQAG
ncbi:MAG: hypothetical protein C4297_01570 [Gemmataceae bacterium]